MRPFHPLFFLLLDLIPGDLYHSHLNQARLDYFHLDIRTLYQSPLPVFIPFR